MILELAKSVAWKPVLRAVVLAFLTAPGRSEERV